MNASTSLSFLTLARKFRLVFRLLSEPNRTERLLANPLSLRKQRASDILEAYQYAYMPLAGGTSIVSVYFNHLILTGQQVLSVLCGIGNAGVMDDEWSRIQVQVINGVQYLVFLYIWTVFPAADRADNLMFAAQFALEAIQTTLLFNQGDDPIVASDLQAWAFSLSLLALAVPLLRRFYDGVIVQCIKMRRQGPFNRKAAGLAFFIFLLQIQSFLANLLGLGGEASSMVSSVSSNAAKLANREAASGLTAALDAGVELTAEAYAMLYGADGPEIKHSDAARQIQRFQRAKSARALANRMRLGLVYIQAVARGYLARGRRRDMAAARFIQAVSRGVIARRQVRAYVELRKASWASTRHDFASRPGAMWLAMQETRILAQERISESRPASSQLSFPISLSSSKSAHQEKARPVVSILPVEARRTRSSLRSDQLHDMAGVVFMQHKAELGDAFGLTRQTIARSALPATYPPGRDGKSRRERLVHDLFHDFHLLWEDIIYPAVRIVFGYCLLGSQTFPPIERKRFNALKAKLAKNRQKSKRLDDDIDGDDAADAADAGDGGDGGD